MRNSVNSFIQREKDLDIELNESNIDAQGDQYRTLQIGGYLTLFMSDKQLKQLMVTIDEELNEVTYSDLQENYEELLERNTTLIEIARGE